MRRAASKLDLPLGIQDHESSRSTPFQPMTQSHTWALDQPVHEVRGSH
jgi:hypothetical protein